MYIILDKEQLSFWFLYHQGDLQGLGVALDRLGIYCYIWSKVVFVALIPSNSMPSNSTIQFVIFSRSRVTPLLYLPSNTRFQEHQLNT